MLAERLIAMDSDGGFKKRFGDAEAPRVIPKRIEHLAPFLIGLQVSVAVGVATVVLVWAFVDGEPTQILAHVTGVAISTLMCAVLFLLWLRYWAGLRSAFLIARRTNPSKLVLAGCLPQLPDDIREQTWPMSLAPIPASQHAVVTVDRSGVTVLSVRNPPNVVIHLGWSDVVSITGVEYVEAGKAYDGIAFHGPTRDRAVIVQPVRVTVMGPRFSRGTHLDELVANLLAQRPTVAENGPT